MIQGSCLCGGVKFEITRAVGPFELCHCSRCRKASGSAFAAGLGVLREDFRTTENIENQLAVYTEDMRRDFTLRVSELDTILLIDARA